MNVFKPNKSNKSNKPSNVHGIYSATSNGGVGITPKGFIPSHYNGSTTNDNRLAQYNNKYAEIFCSNGHCIPFESFDAGVFNNWLNFLPVFKTSITKETISGRSRFGITVQRTANSRSIQLRSLVMGTKELQLYNILKQIVERNIIDWQNDHTEIGEPGQDSEQLSTTILTSDSAVERDGTADGEDICLKKICNTEGEIEMPILTNRHQPMATVSFTSGDKTKYAWVIPEYIFKQSMTPITSAFRNFIYSDMDIEFEVTVTANRFQCGKLILSYFPDGHDNIDTFYANAGSMLQRPHIILDTGENNQGRLIVPNHFRRSLIRNVATTTTNVGVRTGNMATLQLSVLSPFSSKETATTHVSIMYRFVRAKFSALSFAAEPTANTKDYSYKIDASGVLEQGPITDLVEKTVPGAKLITSGIRIAGKMLNYDAPDDMRENRIVIAPRSSLAHGVGVTDAYKLTMDQHTTVTQLADHLNYDDPLNVKQIAQKWGWLAQFTWDTANEAQNKSGATIYNEVIDPLTMISKNGQNWLEIPTPLQQVASMYNYWGGTIKYKIDFVTTQYHTAVIQAEILFGRNVTEALKSASTYTKTFQLGEQKSFEVVVPYIYDTPFRRTNQSQFVNVVPESSAINGKNGDQNYITSWSGNLATSLMGNNLSVAEEVKTYLRLVVLTPCKLIGEVPAQVNVLIHHAGGDDIRFHSLMNTRYFKPASMPDTMTNLAFDKTEIFSSDLPNTVVNYPGERVAIHYLSDKYNDRNAGGVLAWLPKIDTDNVVPLTYAGPKKTEKVVEQIEDQTATLSAGIRNITFHTTDDQTNIKDIMRRSVYMCTHKYTPRDVQRTYGVYEVTSGTNLLYIPVMYPNHFHTPMGATASYPVSPQAFLATLFRHWRGSLRYTLVFTETTTPITITYAPHAGYTVDGVTTVPDGEITFKWAGQADVQMEAKARNGGRSGVYNETIPGASGMATEIVIPSVNPTISVTMPFDTNLNRCVNATRLFTTKNEINATARDEVAFHAGHLVLHSTANFTVNVWIAAGDDYVLSDYVGSLSYRLAGVRRIGDDSVFQVTKLAKSGQTYLHAVEQGPITDAAQAMIIPATVAGVTGVAAYTINRSVNKLDGAMREVAHTLNDRASEIIHPTMGLIDEARRFTVKLDNNLTNLSVDTLTRRVKHQICEVLSTPRTCPIEEPLVDGTPINILYSLVKKLAIGFEVQMEKVFGTVVFSIYDFMTDLMVAIQAKKISVYITLVFKYIGKIMNKPETIILSALTTLSTFFDNTQIFDRPVALEQNTATTSDITKCAGLLLGIVGTLLGTKLAMTKPTENYFAALIKRMTDVRGLSYITQAISVVAIVTGCISGAVAWAFKLVKPSEYLRDSLLTKDDKIKRFMAQTLILMKSINAGHLNRQSIKRQIWANYILAEQIIAILSLEDNSVCARILAHARQFVKWVNENVNILTCSPLRYEPMVIGIVGDTGVGKSFAADDIALTILDAIGYKTSNPSIEYVRPAGRKFWDGYVNQPVIRFDDFMNLADDESLRDTIGALYELKSPAMFIPNQASLEDKNKCANPYAILLLMNVKNAYPHTGLLEKIVPTPEAVLRRREVMLRVELSPEAQTILRNATGEQTVNDLPEEMLKHNRHIVFYKNKSMVDERIGEAMTYDEMKLYVRTFAITYHAKELKKLHQRAARLQAFMRKPENIDIPGDDLVNFVNFDTFTIPGDEDYMPSEMLDYYYKQIEDRFEQLPPTDGIEEIFGCGSTPVEQNDESSYDIGPYSTCRGCNRLQYRGRRITKLWVKKFFGFDEFVESGIAKEYLGDNSVTCNCCTEIPEEWLAGTQCDHCRGHYGMLFTVKNKIVEIPTAGESTADIYADIRTLGEETHSVCWSCFLATSSAAHKCPSCPSHHYKWTLPIVKIFKGLRKSVRWVQFILKMLGKWILFRIMDVQEPISYLWRFLFMAIIVNVTQYLLGIGPYNPKNYCSYHHYKAAHPNGDIESYIEFLKAYSIIEEVDSDCITFDDKAFDDMMSKPHGWEKCIHSTEYIQDLRDNPTEFTYHTFLMTKQDLMADDYDGMDIRPCNHTNCEIFKGVDIYKAAIKQWFTAHRTEIGDTLKSIARRNNMLEYASNTLVDRIKIHVPPFVNADVILMAIVHVAKGDMLDGLMETSGFFSRIMLRVRKFWHLYSDKLKLWGYRLLAGISLCSMFVGVVMSIRSAFKSVRGLFGEIDATEEVISSGDFEKRKLPGQRVKLKSTGVKSNTKEESNAMVMESAMRAIEKNTIIIRVYNRDGMVYRKYSATGLCGNYALMPKHFVRVMREASIETVFSHMRIVRYMDQTKEFAYTFCENDYMCGENSDSAVFKVPASVPPFKSIVHFIADRFDFENMLNRGILMRPPTFEGGAGAFMSIDCKIRGLRHEPIRVDRRDGSGESSVHTDTSIEIDKSCPGYCSGLLLCERVRPIIGMHFAGVELAIPTRGYVLPLVRDNFIDFAQKSFEFEPAPLPDWETAQVKMDSDLSIVEEGRLEKPIHMNVKTELKPSLVHGLIAPVATAPSFLYADRKRGYKHEYPPLILGIAKHGIQTENFTSAEIREATDTLWFNSYIYMKPILAEPQKLTVMEAIMGIAKTPGYESLELQTSMGYPYCQTMRKKKSDYLSIERNNEGDPINVIINDSEEIPLLPYLEGLYKKRSNRIVPFVPYMDLLKDAKVLLTKLHKAGGSRVFCAAGIGSTIPMRQNYLHFAAAYKGKRLDAAHAVGISVNGPEWSQLANMLLENSEHIITLDYSNFGPGYNAVVGTAAYEIINRWTRKYVAGVDDAELDCLAIESCNSLHVARDLAYRQYSGGPSGGALTVNQNGVVNEIYLLIAFKHLCGRYVATVKQQTLYSAYRENVVVFVYGDDVIMSVKPELLPLFNGRTIMDFFSQYGISATSADKTAVMPECTTIFQASFLKCGFKRHPNLSNHWLAPLELVSITDCVNWIRSNINQDEFTIDVCQQAIRLAFGHGPEFFNDWRQRVCEVCAEYDLKLDVPSWAELDRGNFFAKFYD